jgi:hypothetical protein
LLMLIAEGRWSWSAGSVWETIDCLDKCDAFLVFLTTCCSKFALICVLFHSRPVVVIEIIKELVRHLIPAKCRTFLNWLPSFVTAIYLKLGTNTA